MIKFRQDEWVMYCALPDVKVLSHERRRALVLEILDDDLYYDYLIIFDDTGERKKVKSKNLFPIEE